MLWGPLSSVNEFVFDGDEFALLFLSKGQTRFSTFHRSDRARERGN